MGVKYLFSAHVPFDKTHRVLYLSVRVIQDVFGVVNEVWLDRFKLNLGYIPSEVIVYLRI